MQHAMPRTDASRVDDVLAEHLARRFGAGERADLRAQFQRDHVAPLRGLCPPRLFEPLKAEAFDLMDRFGVARDFALDITDGTPRHMTTVGQPIIKDAGPGIDALYFSAALKAFLSEIVGEALSVCPYPGEHYVISRLHKSGDTHGWHWDDYAYGFVLVLEAPHYREGGFVQAVPHTAWDKRQPDVHGALLQSQVHSYAFEPGDAYVIKTDTTMHRVYPIRGNARRTIVNTTWANALDLAVPKTHETNDILFGGAAPNAASAR